MMTIRHSTMWRLRFLVTGVICILGLIGCDALPNPLRKECPLSFHLDPQEDVRIEAPAKITLSFTLRSCDDGPVPHLDAAAFTLLEDGIKQTGLEAPFKVQSSPQVYEFESLLLLDMSGSIIDSGELPALIKAAQEFVAGVAEGEKIAIYTFDGRASIHKVVGFTDDVATLQEGIQSLEGYQIVDRSTNLYGAVANAQEILDERIKEMNSPLSAASLIVFTDGTHRAGTGEPGYPTLEAVLTSLEAADIAVFTIGLGGEIDKAVLGSIGKDGFVWANNVKKLPDAFGKLRDFAYSTYVLTYCSPARAGDHTLTLAVKWKGMEGTYDYKFKADEDFYGGCTLGE